MQAIQVSFWVIALLVALAVVFDFMNGFHDAANSIATVVSTGVLKPHQAVAFAAFFNFVALFVFQLKVAATVGKGIVMPGVVDHYVVFGALIGAIIWNIVTWWYGIPSSSSHALIGGIVGAVMAKVGRRITGCRRGLEDGRLHPRVAAAGLPAGFADDGGGGLALPPQAAAAGRRCFRRLQLVSAGLYSLGHGGNDAQKTIGIIWMLLIATGYASATDSFPPGWVIWSCYIAIGAGHHVRRLAHRQDDGAEDHQVEAGGRLLRRDRRGDHAVPGLRPGHPGVDHAHHHRRHRRRRLDAARLGGALGRGRQHRLGLDLHDPGFGADGRAWPTGSAACCSELRYG